MANITKRKNSYLIRVSCGYDVSGKKITQAMTWKPEPGMTGRQIQKELQKQAVMFEQACQGKQIVNTMKFEELAEEWFEQYALVKQKTQTINRNKQLRERTYKAIGYLRIDKITPRHIQNFINELSKTPLDYTAHAVYKGELSEDMKKLGMTQKAFAKRAGLSERLISNVRNHQSITWDSAEKIAAVFGKTANSLFVKNESDRTLSPKTIKHYINFISGVFNYAIKMRMISDNPCKYVIMPNMQQAERDCYTLEEAQKFLDLLRTAPIKYQAFFNLAMYGGFRRGELLGFEWKDIDFESGVVNVARTALYTSEKGHYTDTPKTKSSVRSLKLPQSVMFVLKRLQNEQNSQRLKLGDQWNATDRLFTTWNGLPMDGATPYNWLKKFCAENDMRFVNLHSFRHLNASLLISSGVNVRTVSACLGHSTPTTTLNIYAHAFEEANAKAMEAVANALETSGTMKNRNQA